MSGISGIASLDSVLAPDPIKIPRKPVALDNKADGAVIKVEVSGLDYPSNTSSPTSASQSPESFRSIPPIITVTPSAVNDVSRGPGKPKETASVDPPSVQATEIDAEDWKLAEPPAALFHLEPEASPEIYELVDTFQKQCRQYHEQALSKANPRSQSRTMSAAMSAADSVFSRPDSVARTSTTSISLASLDGSLGKGKGLASDGDDISLTNSSTGIIFEESADKVSRATKLKRLLKGKMPMKTLSFPTLSHPTLAVECSSCFEDLPSQKAVSLACKHFYCTECFVQLIRTAMQNESFWPPKCCLQEIPRPKIIKKLPDGVLKEFGTKEKEYNTPVKSRWYCTRSTCGLWFEGKKVKNLTRCPHCGYEMCTFCRGQKHKNAFEKCPQDKNRQLLDEEAELEGWRQCYSCHQMVELTTGCRHITCTCKAEFCYTCGARWKTCSCTEDDQRARNDRLREKRENRQQEDLELEAALEAVAAAERREREERILEEKRTLESMEEARVASIRSRYVELRDELEKLIQAQHSMVEEEHEREKQAAEARIEANAVDQATLESNLQNEVQKYAQRYKTRCNEHVSERNETIARHNSQTKELKTRLENLQQSMLISGTAAIRHANTLQIEQQKELNEIWDQQRREVDRMESRLEAVRCKPAWEEKRALLREEMQRAEKASIELRKKRSIDKKWLQQAKPNHDALLAGYEAVEIAKGADTASEAITSLLTEVEAIKAENQRAEVSAKARNIEADISRYLVDAVDKEEGALSGYTVAGYTVSGYMSQEKGYSSSSNADRRASADSDVIQSDDVPRAESSRSGMLRSLRSPDNNVSWTSPFRVSGNSTTRGARLGQAFHTRS